MRIRILRKQAGMTQEDLAEELGVDRSSVARWECGFNAPRTSMLPKVAKALGCTVGELYGEQPENRGA